METVNYINRFDEILTNILKLLNSLGEGNFPTRVLEISDEIKKMDTFLTELDENSKKSLKSEKNIDDKAKQIKKMFDYMIVQKQNQISLVGQQISALNNEKLVQKYKIQAEK